MEIKIGKLKENVKLNCMKIEYFFVNHDTQCNRKLHPLFDYNCEAANTLKTN